MNFIVVDFHKKAIVVCVVDHERRHPHDPAITTLEMAQLAAPHQYGFWPE